MSARGEVVLEHATRRFKLVHERPRTLKEAFVARGRERSEVVALDDVSLRVAPGESLGLVGRNGAGKTSTLRCLAGIVPLDSGRADCGGRVAALLELGAGFGEDFSGRENIHLNGALHGLAREEIEERVDAIVEFSELGDFIDVPVKAYSAGMYLRLGFSIVAHLDADVLLIDEILAVGDESFQRKCLRRISEQMSAGATLVLVSHDPGAIERVCERVAVLDHGRLAFDGGMTDGLLFYHRLTGTEAGGGESLRPDRGGLWAGDFELRDADGHPRRMFRTGEALCVWMAVESAEPVERALVALELRDAGGALLFRTDHSLGRVDGRTELTFAVPRLNLLAGDYDLAVGVAAHDAPGGGQLDRVTRFAVARTEGGEGTVDLRGEWSVGNAAAEEVAP